MKWLQCRRGEQDMIGCERRERYGKPAKSSALTHIWEVLRLVISINFLPKKINK